MFSRRVGSIVLVVAVVATGSRSPPGNIPRSKKRMPQLRISRSPSKRCKRPLPRSASTDLSRPRSVRSSRSRSISVRNELPGTVRHVALEPGQIVEARHCARRARCLSRAGRTAGARGAGRARADAVRAHARTQRATRRSAEEVDSARAERDVALAQIARIKATIDRKTIRAPFRARVGISDVHPGQYLNEGTLPDELARCR